MAHQEDGVDVPFTFTGVGLHRRHHVFGDQFTRLGPFVKDHVVAFVICHLTAVIGLTQSHDFFFSILDVVHLGIRCDQVVGAEGQATASGLAEAHLHHVIEQVNRGATAQSLIAIANHRGQVTTTHGSVIEVHAVGKHFVKANASRRGFDDLSVNGVFIGWSFQALVPWQTHLDLGVQVDHALSKREFNFVVTGEHHAFAFLGGQFAGHVVTTHHDVL